jgi:hypothetical protein
MIKSPLIQEIVAKRMQKDIVRILNARFSNVSPEIIAALQGIGEEAKLEELIDLALNSPSLEAFRDQVSN